MKYLLCLLLITTVYYKVPFGDKEVYEDVLRYELVGNGNIWKILLKDRTIVYLPVAWTRVEEK